MQKEERKPFCRRCQQAEVTEHSKRDIAYRTRSISSSYKPKPKCNYPLKITDLWGVGRGLLSLRPFLSTSQKKGENNNLTTTTECFRS